MKSEIKNKLCCELSRDLNVLLSWGLKNVEELRNGISLHVNGFLYQGVLEIIHKPKTDNFEIWKVTDRRERVKNNVDLKSIVDEIDRIVEKNCPDEEYEKQIKEFYKI